MIQQQPWWIDRLLIPGFFVVLGAAVGFCAGRLRDYLEARAQKKDFLSAIRHELCGLEASLKASFDAVKEGEDRFAGSQGSPPQFAAALRTTVFSTRLSKLRDISDPLILEVIQLYSDLPALEQIRDLLNKKSGEYTGASAEVRGRLKPEILSATKVLVEQIEDYVHRVGELIRRLQARLS